MRRTVAIWLAVLALPITSLGAIAIGVDDHFDSFQSVLAAQMLPEVADALRELHDVVVASVPRNLCDVEGMLGRPIGTFADSTYAMPLCQRRVMGMTGFHRGQSKRHFEFYRIDELGGLQVLYLHDSTTVADIGVYVKVDSTFMPYNRETQNQIGRRIEWDRVRVAALMEALLSKRHR